MDRQDAAKLTETRRVWRELVNAVEGLSSEFGTETLGQARRRASPVGFPVEGHAADLASRALITLAEAFALTAIESRRYHIGQALTATARCVDGLLDEHLQAAADLARLRIGERD